MGTPLCREFETERGCKFGDRCRFLHLIATDLLDPPKWLFTCFPGLDLHEYSQEEIRAFFYESRANNSIKSFEDGFDSIWTHNYNKISDKLNELNSIAALKGTSERVVDIRENLLAIIKPFEIDRIYSEIQNKNTQPPQNKEISYARDGNRDSQRNFRDNTHKPHGLGFHKPQFKQDFRGPNNNTHDYSKQFEYRNNRNMPQHGDTTLPDNSGINRDSHQFYNNQHNKGFNNSYGPKTTYRGEYNKFQQYYDKDGRKPQNNQQERYSGPILPQKTNYLQNDRGQGQSSNRGWNNYGGQRTWNKDNEYQGNRKNQNEYARTDTSNSDPEGEILRRVQNRRGNNENPYKDLNDGNKR